MALGITVGMVTGGSGFLLITGQIREQRTEAPNPNALLGRLYHVGLMCKRLCNLSKIMTAFEAKCSNT